MNCNRLRAGMVAALALVVTGLSAPAALAGETAKGVVFCDTDGNGRQGPEEKPLAGVRVSNGRDVVLTDAQGRYELAVDDDDIIFVIKPRNYLTPVDGLNLPKFYYVHKPAGSPTGLEYAGVAPTGPLPASVDFPLVPHPEPDEFKVIFLGDPQPSDVTAVNYLARDVVPELIGTDAAFGVSLGDVANNNLATYEPYNAAISTIGIPWHNVHGNHDENYDVATDELADETWERVYGPPTYSFDWGPVHFIVVDDVVWEGQKARRYHCEFRPHLSFIEQDLRHVPKDQLVVLMMHIPVIEANDKEALFNLLRDRPYTFSISAHWHVQAHFFLGSDEGWLGPKPHHHLVNVTSCGSWWAGAPDEYGLPHTMMRDGAPNGYTIATFRGNEYSLRFKGARCPATHQMSIHAPDSVKSAEAGTTEIVANVFGGSERSVIEMRVGSGPWQKMEQVKRPDPYYVAIKAAEESVPPVGRRKMPRVEDSPHLWAAKLPAGLPPGNYVLEVRSRDMFGQEDFGRHVLRVE